MIRTFLLAMAVALTLGTGGCAKMADIGTFITSGFQNPIGRNEVAAAVSTYNALLVPTRAYMRLRVCKSGESFTANVCGEPAMRAQIKAAVFRSQAVRRDLVKFVAANDTVNATAAYNEFSALLDILRAVPKAGG